MGDGVGLDHVARAESSDSRAQREHIGQRPKALFHAEFNVIHGAAADIAIGINFAMHDGQGAFGVLDGHTEKGRNPHPKNRARAAVVNSSRYAADIADADRG